MDARKIKILLTSFYQFSKALVVLSVGSITNIMAFFVNTDTSLNKPEDEVSDLFGEHNFRTERPDSGTDPDGWYEEDM